MSNEGITKDELEMKIQQKKEQKAQNTVEIIKERNTNEAEEQRKQSIFNRGVEAAKKALMGQKVEMEGDKSSVNEQLYYALIEIVTGKIYAHKFPWFGNKKPVYGNIMQAAYRKQSDDKKVNVGVLGLYNPDHVVAITVFNNEKDWQKAQDDIANHRTEQKEVEMELLARAISGKTIKRGRKPKDEKESKDEK